MLFDKRRGEIRVGFDTVGATRPWHPRSPQRRPSTCSRAATGAGDAKQNRAHFARTLRSAGRALAGTTARTFGWLRSRRRNIIPRRSSPTGRTVRSASRGGDTRIPRFGYGRTLESGDRRWVDIFHRVKVRPREPADLTVCRLAGHDQTPKQPKDAMVEANTSTDSVPLGSATA